ncbi:ATP-binding protein [Shewanella algae]|uniref:AAA family ATPase n=1 Tax=Shewanella algae TaxID=38313 RepID=UPI0031F56DD9
MIKKLGFRNFYSFKEGVEINFLGKDTGLDETDETNISKVLGIKGANGSGKTNILKAITFLYCFCSRRINTAKKDSEIDLPFTSFMDNDEITEFYIEFIRKGTTYYYELDIKPSGIVREEIRRKIKKEVICIVRNKNKVTQCLKEFSELKNLRLKADQSIISVTDDFDFNTQMVDLEIMNWNFTRILFNVGYNGYRNIESDNYFEVSEFYYQHQDAFEFTKKVIESVDDGISNITIEETTDSETGETIFYPMFLHSDGDIDFSIGLSHESMGTKALFFILQKYWLAIKDGSLLVLDEFDTHLHAMILPELLELFENPKININNAQLIITAHNTEIIDSLGRYKTILVNKENNESYCFRLDDISLLRNDRPISPLYNKGKIGGIPKSIEGLTSRLADSWGTPTNE